jgi:hypothetical protein
MRRLLASLTLLALLALPRGAQAFKPHWHKAVVWTGLSFLRPEFLKQLLAVQDEVDGFHPRYAGVDRLHFNDCAFDEAIASVNTTYRAAVDALGRQDTTRTARLFGMALHAAQDFYAHSNWVDYDERVLVDEGLTFWRPLAPWSEVRPGLVVLATSSDIPAPAGVELRRTVGRREVEVLTVGPAGTSKRRGLITGGAFLRGRCPGAVELGHWAGADEGGGLAKDHACRDPGFSRACTMAYRQTLHEWCRFRALATMLLGEAEARLASIIAKPDTAAAICRDQAHLSPQFPGACKCASPR